MGVEDNKPTRDGIPIVVHSIGFCFLTASSELLEGYKSPWATTGRIKRDELDKTSCFRMEGNGWSRPLRSSPRSLPFCNLTSISDYSSIDEPLTFVLGYFDFLNLTPYEHDTSFPDDGITPAVFHYRDPRGSFAKFLKVHLDALFDSEVPASINESVHLRNTLTYHAYAVVFIQDMNEIPFQEVERIGERLAVSRSLEHIGPTESCYDDFDRRQQSVVYFIECPDAVNSVLEDGVFPDGGISDIPQLLRHVLTQEKAIRIYFETMLLKSAIRWINIQCRNISRQIPEELGEEVLKRILELATATREIGIAQFFVHDFLGMRKDELVPPFEFVDRRVSFSDLERHNKNAFQKLRMIQSDLARRISIASIRAEHARQEKEERREIKFNKLQISVGFLVAFEVAAAFLSWALTILELSFLKGILLWAVLIGAIGSIFAHLYAQMR
ncbi:MAG: hypothetical protein ACOC38_08985 [Promethearchaeia archaeon]